MRGKTVPWFVLLASVFFLFALAACGGGGGSGGSGDDTDNDTSYAGGWVSITTPATETASAYCSPFRLAGEAFISDDYYRCCSGSAEDTGVLVTWQNLSTGGSGTAYQSVRVCYLFSTPYLCDHQWWADIPLQDGDNAIKVLAQEVAPGTGWGTDTVTVTKTPGATYAVSGSVATNAGESLSYQNARIDARIYNDALATKGAVSSDGTFRFTCIPNGVYTVDLTAPLSYVFVPGHYEANVNASSVADLDFLTEAYFISGSIVYSTSGTPASSIAVEVSGTAGTMTVFTDVNGQYRLAVPNGTYTVRPYYLLVSDPLDFSPAQVELTINGTDFPNVDFTYSP